MKTPQKRSKAPEILWLAVAAMSLATAIHKTIYVSFGSSWYFYGFVLLAFLMYFVRRSMRKQNR